MRIEKSGWEEVTLLPTTGLPSPEDDEPVLEPGFELGPALPEKPGGLGPRLPRFSDEAQKKAARAILRFFALMLVLTLVARGTAGATLPRVETARPGSAEIIQRVRGTGSVRAGEEYRVEVPEGLTVGEVPVSPGQSVAAGDPLARFDLAEIAEQLQRQQAALREMELRMGQLGRPEIQDTSTLAAAQLRVSRAQQDLDSARAATDAEIAAAQNALAEAQAATAAALAALPDPTDTASPEYLDWQAKSAAEAERAAALGEVQAAAAATMLAAQRELEDANAALAAAQTAGAQAAQQQQDERAQNSVEATTLALDMADLQKKIDALLALQSAGGTLAAPEAGTLRTALAAGAKTAEADAFSLALTEGNYEAEMWVDKKEAEKLSPGDLCEVALSGGSYYSHNIASGSVTSIGEAGEDGKVKVTVRLPEGEWKNGQSLDMQVVQQRANHPVCVPLSALHASSEGYFLLAVQPRQSVLGEELVAVRVPVTVKAQDDTNAAVEGLLGERDDIITSSDKAVQPGDTVRVKDV